MPNVGDVIWIDGDTPALVVGSGVDNDNIADGRLFVAELGGVRVLEPDDDGAYPFGAAPYDANSEPDRFGNVNPGGFGPHTPVAASSSSSGGPVAPAAPDTVGDGGYDPANAGERDAAAQREDATNTEAAAPQTPGAWGSTPPTTPTTPHAGTSPPTSSPPRV